MLAGTSGAERAAPKPAAASAANGAAVAAASADADAVEGGSHEHREAQEGAGNEGDMEFELKLEAIINASTATRDAGGGGDEEGGSDDEAAPEKRRWSPIEEQRLAVAIKSYVEARIREETAAGVVRTAPLGPDGMPIEEDTLARAKRYGWSTKFICRALAPLFGRSYKAVVRKCDVLRQSGRL